MLWVNLALWSWLAPTPAQADEKTWCTCPGGGILEPGAVRYEENSDREIITRIKVEDKDSERHCAAIWISHTEIYPTGTPYSFRLTRKRVQERRIDGCRDASKLFLMRTKTYEFVFDADSRSIREMQPVTPENAAQPATGKASSSSNANLWDSIVLDSSGELREDVKRPSRSASAPEFGRSAWVFARREITGYYVGLAHNLGQESLVTLGKGHRIKAGQLGQIEAFRGRTALVRFYDGSRVEKFAKGKNTLRRWYDRTGGPYTETKDDLYTPIRACILEVSLDDLVEVNDYLDQLKTDRT
jgi:hypothetical protein